jgi:hypothetical protein
MRHERQCPAGRHHLLEEPQGVVGVRVSDEPLWPVGQRLAADPDRLDVLHARGQQRLDVPAQHRGAHDHRVAAGDQHAGHLVVLPQVVRHPVDLGGGHLELGLVHELGPPEAVRAVGVAGLSLLGEDQHRLGVLVLNAGQWLIAQVGDVQRQLPGGVRVEPHPDLVRRRLDLRLGRALGQQGGDVLHVGRGEHVSLREHQPVDRVIRRRGPVDELLDDVRVGAERKHRPDGPYRQPVRGAETGPRGQDVEVFRGVRAEPPSRRRCRRHCLPNPSHASPSGRSCSGGPARAQIVQAGGCDLRAAVTSSDALGRIDPAS